MPYLQFGLYLITKLNAKIVYILNEKKCYFLKIYKYFQLSEVPQLHHTTFTICTIMTQKSYFKITLTEGTSPDIFDPRKVDTKFC